MKTVPWSSERNREIITLGEEWSMVGRISRTSKS